MVPSSIKTGRAVFLTLALSVSLSFSLAGYALQAAEDAAVTNKTAITAIVKNDVGTALAAEQKAIAVLENEKGTELFLALALQNMSQILQAKGNREEARSYSLRARSILRKLLGSADIERFVHTGVLHDIPAASQRPQRQLEFIGQQAKKLTESTSPQPAAKDGPPDESAWKRAYTEGSLHKTAGRFKEAEQKLQLSADLAERFSQPDDRLAMSLNNLAGVYRHTDRLDEAATMYKRAIEIIQQTKGEASPAYATMLDNLAQVLDLQGRGDDALTLQEHAMRVYEQTTGTESVDYAQLLSNVGNRYQQRGKTAEALEHYEKALVIYDRKLPEKDSLKGITLDNIGTVYAKQGQLTRAEEFHRKALSMLRATVGNVHPEVAVALDNLAFVCAAQGKHAEAANLYIEEIIVLNQVFGPDHPRTQHAKARHAESLTKSKQ